MTDRPIALITGGARGIGRACAEALIRDGMRAVLADLDGADTTAAELGGDAVGYACDMGDPAAIAALFDRMEDEIGTATVLVNNAGMARGAPFLDMTLDDWQRVIDVNLTGTFLATQRAGRAMVDAGLKGAIVNMSSINAQVAIPTIASYCASKGGVAQLTKAAALALAPHGIRVNAVGPGSIDTAMLAGINDDAAAQARVLSRTPLGRIGTASEVADVVAFLAGPRSGYVTGETIFVDGGRLALNYTV
ncbi:short-chain dehydrogenase/reductase SDR [Oceaniovalibus guishaninsula JLT2003]|uniref:Short-chain dehydrogenase/reductase SDR n=1 Tax=Oceaniovalibus guishaninsula JLT2003 TaxID=1231392 RepID=K2HM49_9RHOB|nr:SDR family NAD(P)-dependent oxidoreductase [Oceaniovalibus guishaninsula]EKE43959.1 short-chain dehydrogenase/reductase SDR [Oceaniovalibus guishaninsula JLT2003]